MWPFKTSRCWIVPFPYWCRDERNETAPLQTLSPLTLFCPLFPHITVDFSCFPDAIVLGLHHERCNSGDVPKCKKCCQQLQKDKPDVKCDVHSSPALVAQDAVKENRGKESRSLRQTQPGRRKNRRYPWWPWGGDVHHEGTGGRGSPDLLTVAKGKVMTSTSRDEHEVPEELDINVALWNLSWCYDFNLKKRTLQLLRPLGE